MSQTQKISRNNTVQTVQPDGAKSVILHSTEIVRYWPADQKLRLDTGGWFTATTRTRMNQCFNEWALPVRVGFTKKAGNIAETFDRQTGETLETFPFVGSICYLVF